MTGEGRHYCEQMLHVSTSLDCWTVDSRWFMCCCVCEITYRT